MTGTRYYRNSEKAWFLHSTEKETETQSHHSQISQAYIGPRLGRFKNLLAGFDFVPSAIKLVV